MKSKTIITICVLVMFLLFLLIINFSLNLSTISEDTQYVYYCGSNGNIEEQIQTWDTNNYEWVTDETSTLFNCADYYNDRVECKKTLQKISQTKLTEQDLKESSCVIPGSYNIEVTPNTKYTGSCNPQASICTNQQYYCLNVASECGNTATMQWSYSLPDNKNMYNNLKINYNCNGVDNVPGHRYLVFRISSDSNAMVCQQLPGQFMYKCGTFPTNNPDEMRNDIYYDITGQINVTYDLIRSWGKQNNKDIYVKIGCVGQYYNDYNGYYSFMQDYIKVSPSQFYQCNVNNDCNYGITERKWIEPEYSTDNCCLVLNRNDGVKREYCNDCYQWNRDGNVVMCNKEGTSCTDPCNNCKYEKKTLIKQGYYTNVYGQLRAMNDEVCIDHKCKKICFNNNGCLATQDCKDNYCQDKVCVNGCPDKCLGEDKLVNGTCNTGECNYTTITNGCKQNWFIKFFTNLWQSILNLFKR